MGPCMFPRVKWVASGATAAWVAFTIFSALGCTAARKDEVLGRKVLIGRGTATARVLDLPAEAAVLSAGKPIEARDLCALPGATLHLLLVRGEEQPHEHPDQDLIVVLLRGKGSMLLGSGVHPVQAGDVIVVERGAKHAFQNRTPEGSLALVVRVPPSTPSSTPAER